jgi:hypothetical protein
MKRTCLCGCGGSITHLRPQAKWLNEAHRKRAARAVTHSDEQRARIEAAEKARERFRREYVRASASARFPTRVYDHGEWVPRNHPRNKALIEHMNRRAWRL